MKEVVKETRLQSAMRQLLGADLNKKESANSVQIVDWTPNNIKSLIVGTKYMCIEYHLVNKKHGVNKKVQLCDLRGADTKGASVFKIIETPRMLSSIEELILINEETEASYTDLQYLQQLKLKELQTLYPRLRYISVIQTETNIFSRLTSITTAECYTELLSTGDVKRGIPMSKRVQTIYTNEDWWRHEEGEARKLRPQYYLLDTIRKEGEPKTEATALYDHFIRIGKPYKAAEGEKEQQGQQSEKIIKSAVKLAQTHAYTYNMLLQGVTNYSITAYTVLLTKTWWQNDDAYRDYNYNKVYTNKRHLRDVYNNARQICVKGVAGAKLLTLNQIIKILMKNIGYIAAHTELHELLKLSYLYCYADASILALIQESKENDTKRFIESCVQLSCLTDGAVEVGLQKMESAQMHDATLSMELTPAVIEMLYQYSKAITLTTQYMAFECIYAVQMTKYFGSMRRLSLQWIQTDEWNRDDYIYIDSAYVELVKKQVPIDFYKDIQERSKTVNLCVEAYINKSSTVPVYEQNYRQRMLKFGYVRINPQKPQQFDIVSWYKKTADIGQVDENKLYKGYKQLYRSVLSELSVGLVLNADEIRDTAQKGSVDTFKIQLHNALRTAMHNR